MMKEPYVGATEEQLRSPMVRELLAVHSMFRDQLQAILNYVNDLISGDEQLRSAETNIRVQMLIRAGTQYTHMLHFHHHAETETMFPVLQRDGLDTAVIDRLNADHDELGVMIDRFSESIQHFATIEPDVMNNDLRRLADALQAHLAYEETHVCPFLSRWTHWPMH